MADEGCASVVSWVPQLVVPPLVALAFLRRLPRAWVLALAPSVFLADLDYFVPGEHRVYTHTLLLPAVLLAVVLYAWDAGGRTSPFWWYACAPGGPAAVTIVAYYLAAHDVMDVFTGGVALLWPVVGTVFFLDFTVDLDLVHRRVLPKGDAEVSPTPAPLDDSYPWLTAEHSAILGFLVAVGLVAVAWVAWRRGRGPA